MFPNEPICNIKWVHVSDLQANNYNPNVVFTSELKLLEYSILQNGWIQPVLCNPNGIIIDGFHRWSLAQESKPINDKYGGRVPCVELNINDAEAMLLTIRINRAKGSHVAIRMSAIVQKLIDDYGMTPSHVATSIGAEKAEIDLLYAGNVFKQKNIDAYRYSKAWYPVEDKNAKEEY
jgi:ParB-like chromosome segregation protein Spo0J